MLNAADFALRVACGVLRLAYSTTRITPKVQVPWILRTLQASHTACYTSTTTCRSWRLLSIGYTEPLRCYHLPSTWHRVTFLASFAARRIRFSVDTTTYLEDSEMMTFLTARCWTRNNIGCNQSDFVSDCS
jgi:hypothetical protein